LRALEVSSPKGADLARQAQVVPIDPSHSDTDALNAHYSLDPEATGNCVLVAGKRTGQERIAACVVRATDFADVNHVVKKRIYSQILIVLATAKIHILKQFTTKTKRNLLNGELCLLLQRYTF
ncbi:MAG: hypothetical protein ACFNLR_06935, partial [Prevotella denticola]